jgi:hypothetical protein
MVCAGRLFGLPVTLVGKSVAGIDTRSAGKGGDFGKYPFAAWSIAFGAIRGKKSLWEMRLLASAALAGRWPTCWE